ncbi:hypothetical protein [Streptomyces sp. NBC_01439]|uniref:hypothetical protein n=1 Tax=Streptomyces sp. NBC_01439 TaxID=2903867 RepID=UPI0024A18E61|nr:hypothetical protein [Streptomyces sp. NBC_01439]GLW02566.1 hypothetical protein Slala05_61960 [Streptomyces lavendulae subsp. lavendulae]
MTAAAPQEQAGGVNVRPASGQDEARPQTSSQTECRPPVPVPDAVPAGRLLTEAVLW